MFLNLQILRALSKYITPKKENRVALTGVLVEINQDKVFYVATDGHKLAAFQSERFKGDQLVEGKYIIPKSVIDSFKNKTMLDAGFTYNPEFNGSYTLSDTVNSVTFNLVDSDFPDWRSILKRLEITDEKDKPADIDPAYLQAIQECYLSYAKAVDPRRAYRHVVKLFQNGKSPSYMVAEGDSRFIGVVMPYRAPENAEKFFILDNWMKKDNQAAVLKAA